MGPNRFSDPANYRRRQNLGTAARLLLKLRDTPDKPVYVHTTPDKPVYVHTTPDRLQPGYIRQPADYAGQSATFPEPQVPSLRPQAPFRALVRRSPAKAGRRRTTLTTCPRHWLISRRYDDTAAISPREHCPYGPLVPASWAQRASSATGFGADYFSTGRFTPLSGVV